MSSDRPITRDRPWSAWELSICPICCTRFTEYLDSSNRCPTIGACDTYLHCHPGARKIIRIDASIVEGIWRFSNSSRRYILRQAEIIKKL